MLLYHASFSLSDKGEVNSGVRCENEASMTSYSYGVLENYHLTESLGMETGSMSVGVQCPKGFWASYGVSRRAPYAVLI